MIFMNFWLSKMVWIVKEIRNINGIFKYEKLSLLIMVFWVGKYEKF